MMKSTPVRFSSARMLRPSRPMIRPFMSSEGSCTTETVVSAAWPAASRCMATDEDRAHAALGVALGLLLDLAHEPGRVVARLVLDLLEQRCLACAGAQAGDALQRARVLVAQARLSSCARRSSAVALGAELVLAAVELRGSAVERALALRRVRSCCGARLGLARRRRPRRRAAGARCPARPAAAARWPRDQSAAATRPTASTAAAITISIAVSSPCSAGRSPARSVSRVRSVRPAVRAGATKREGSCGAARRRSRRG